MHALASKLGPDKVKVSPKFRAILGAMLDADWTRPRLVELCATSDGHFLAREEGDIGFNEYIGTVADLRRNCKGLADAVGLDMAERKAFLALIPRA